MLNDSDSMIAVEHATVSVPVTGNVHRACFFDLPAELRNDIYDPSQAPHKAAQISRQFRAEYLSRHYYNCNPLITISPTTDWKWTADISHLSTPVWPAYFDLNEWQRVFGKSRIPLFRQFSITSGTVEAFIDLDQEPAAHLRVVSHPHLYTWYGRYRRYPHITVEMVEELAAREIETVQAEVKGLVSLGLRQSDVSVYLTQRGFSKVIKCIMAHERRLSHVLRKMRPADLSQAVPGTPEP